MNNTVDHIAARELELYACNFSESHYNTVGKTLSRFYKAGTYNHDRAIAYIDRYLVIPAAKDYKLSFGGMTDIWHSMFPKATRTVAAESIANSFVSEFKIGNLF
jgi:hypothetical protein